MSESISDAESKSSEDITSLPNVYGSQSSPANDLPIHTSVAHDAGPLWKDELCDDNSLGTVIPHKGRSRKRVLVLCTGGTLTMQVGKEIGSKKITYELKCICPNYSIPLSQSLLSFFSFFFFLFFVSYQF
jgi:hypothetical protein